MHYSVFGATGFIGSAFVEHMRSRGVICREIPRGYDFASGEDLGHVIYAIGLTADFRQRPMDAIRAHVSHLVEVVERSTYTSFLYLSSTRVYNKSTDTREGADLAVNPNDFSDLYNISKLMGESACLAMRNPLVRVARLSNVIGNDFRSENFVTSLVKDAVGRHAVVLQSSPLSEKDYIRIEDVVELLRVISESGVNRLYNVASGFNISNRAVVEALVAATGCRSTMDEAGQLIRFAPIAVERLITEFAFSPKDPLESIRELVINYKKIYDTEN